MSARWLALSLLLFAAGFYWLSTKPIRLSRSRGTSTTLVLVYLGMTFLSVITAENPLFSGLKWASHAAMIIVFLVFLWQSLPINQVTRVLTILRILLALLLFASLLKPISTIKSQDVELFRGAFGSPNAMGQIAAVGGLMFFHSFIASKASWLRRAEIIMACMAAWLVWSSGARSAMVTSITGLILMSYFYPAKLGGKAFWIILLAAGLAFAVPDLPKAAKHFLLRGGTETKTFSEQIFNSRTSVWKSAWEGFQKRPLFGWGFGADDTISKGWGAKLTAIGVITRDNVNDTLIVLESTGLIGLLAYALLALLAMKQLPTRQQRFLITKIHGPPFVTGGADLSTYDVHVIVYIIALSLLVTVQFDNTALSAGNLVSVTLWLCVALAGAIKAKAVTYESAVARHQKLSKHKQAPEQGISIPPRPWDSSIPA